MMKIKKLMSIISCMAILFCYMLNVYAYDESETSIALNDVSTIQDTTSKTQEEYVTLAESVTLRRSSDEQIIRTVCETFLTLAKAAVRNSSAYDSTVMINSDSLKNDTIQYRLSEYEYQTELREKLGWDIVRDEVEFSDFKVSYNNGLATVSIVEKYSYYANDGFNRESVRVKEYTFTLEKSDTNWRITDIKTNDPYELSEGFEYIPIDVTEAVAVIETELYNQSIKTQNEIAVAVSRDAESSIGKSNTLIRSTEATSLYHWSYDADAAAAYATQYYNSINSLFGEASADCQNFASQCVWAGFGGASTKTGVPAVSTSLVGSDSSRVWCKDQSTTYYDDYRYNWAWTYCKSFAKLIDSSSYDQVGPLGWVYYGDLLNASVGDVIQWDEGGAPSDLTVDHAMFVTATTGTKGTRTVSNIYVCAHNSYTNYASEALATYAPAYMDASYFANERIASGYYPVAQ